MARPKNNKDRPRASTRPTGSGPSRRATAGQSAPPRRPWWRDDRTRFVLTFTVLAGCLLALYYFPRSDEDAVEQFTADYLRFYTRVVSWPIGVFDPQVSAHGNLVAGRFSMQIVKSCDAMEANILFVAALLAVSAPWLRKAAALMAGLCALVTFNLVRLFVLYWVGVFIPSVFDFLHLDVWPLLMMAFAAVDFVVCARWTRRVTSTAVAPQEVGGYVAG